MINCFSDAGYTITTYSVSDRCFSISTYYHACSGLSIRYQDILTVSNSVRIPGLLVRVLAPLTVLTSPLSATCLRLTVVHGPAADTTLTSCLRHHLRHTLTLLSQIDYVNLLGRQGWNSTLYQILLLPSARPDW